MAGKTLSRTAKTSSASASLVKATWSPTASSSASRVSGRSGQVVMVRAAGSGDMVGAVSFMVMVCSLLSVERLGLVNRMGLERHERLIHLTGWRSGCLGAPRAAHDLTPSPMRGGGET